MALFDWISASTGVELIPEFNLFWFVTTSVGLQPGALRSFACQHDYIFSSWEFFPCYHSKYIITFVCRSCASTKIPQDSSTHFPIFSPYFCVMMKRCSGEFLCDGWRSLLCSRRVFAVWGRKRRFVQVYGCHSSVYPGSVLCLETGALTEVKRPLRPQKHSRTSGKGGVQEQRSLASPL